MTERRKRNLRGFLLKLALAYLLLIALWPFVKDSYNRGLGVLCAPVVRVLSFDKVTVSRGWLENRLLFELRVIDEARGTYKTIGVAIDPVPYSFGHVTFASLAIAIPGWVWRRRLARWLAGTIALQAFFVFMMVLNVFSVIAGMEYDYWSGDLITAVVPHRIYLTYRAFLGTVGNQLVPALLWLALFVYPLRNRRSAVSAATGPTRPAKKLRG